MAGLSNIFGGGDDMGPDANDLANQIDNADNGVDAGGADQGDAGDVGTDAGVDQGGTDHDLGPNYDLTYAEPLGGSDHGFDDGSLA